ncbi:MAG: HD domain-containing protein [Leptospiraceae bacterium]|nr:HD domain-containing protein [Leptospiraceae bacterium]
MDISLSDCEKEQIHIPELIQPHGYVLVFNKNTHIITRYSENFEHLIEQAKDKLIGKRISDVIPSSVYKTIKTKLDFSMYKRHTFFNAVLDQYFEKPIDIIICDAIGEIILELVPNSNIEEDIHSMDIQLNEIVRKVITTQQINSLFDVAAIEIRKLSGYDRVMIYRFDEEFNGEVIAESREAAMESYLNLHYPASDIPAQARELYKTNMIRTIVDIHYKPVRILKSINESSAPLDMSHSYLRSVSPIHLEYLHNMGVRATLTISIMVNGKLWGLISCHHRTAFSPNIKRLNLVEIFGNILGGIIQAREESENEKRSSELLARLDLVMEMLLMHEKSSDLMSLIQKKIHLLQSIFSSDGFLVYTNNAIIAHNFPFPENEIKQLIDCLKPLVQDKIFHTDNLVSVNSNLPEVILEMCAGLIVMKLDTQPSSYWIWRRNEKTQTISWGGNPNQKAILNQQGVISPRKSFEKYNQIVTKKSISWDISEKEFYIHLIPRLYRLHEIFESNKELEHHKQHILHIEEERAKHFEELIEMLVSVIEMRDAYTGNHTRRVASYSLAIGKELKINKEDINRLREAAILHDIGKLIIPDTILLKPGKLSYKEYELIKQHVIVGHQILDKIDYYKPIAHIVLNHHEKYNGTGYPLGKKGSEIPFLSQIMIVADSFDAMTTNRIYQPRKTFEEALAELIKYRGIWYHPEVVDATVRMVKNLQIIESETSQMPFTQIEKERFSYFFKDQLTNIYNATYLWRVINDLIPGMHYNYFLMIELRGMTDYNSHFGWNKGNEIIQELAQVLIKITKEEQLFRVFGDDFIVCFETLDAKDSFLAAWKITQIQGVLCNCRSIEKNMFIEIL